jgi:signal transduction histidine kinase
LRQSIWNLRSSLPESFDLAAALRRIAEAMTQSAGVSVAVEIRGAPAQPPGALVEENLFRIGQEALTNAIKHSRASRIVVALHYDGACTELTVSDDGVGIASSVPEPGADGRFGLLGMRERAQRIGAELRIENQLPHGSRVSVVVSGRAAAASRDPLSATA